MKKASHGKGVIFVCLCLVLLGFLASQGVFSGLLKGKIDMGASFPPGSSNNPYTISATQGTSCTAWHITLDGVPGKPWCASTVPTSMHAGDYVHLSFGVLFQAFTITSLDASQHSITLGSIG